MTVISNTMKCMLHRVMILIVILWIIIRLIAIEEVVMVRLRLIIVIVDKMVKCDGSIVLLD
jgi:hypothetical protein